MKTMTNASSRLGHMAKGISVAALIALVPAAAVAQSSNGGSKLDPTKADELHQKAEQLLATYQVTKWKEVAGLLEDAAALRQADDPTAVEELGMGCKGWILRYLILASAGSVNSVSLDSRVSTNTKGVCRTGGFKSQPCGGLQSLPQESSVERMDRLSWKAV